MARLLYPKGPCSQIDIHRPQSTQIGTTLRPKYILFGYMDKRDPERDPNIENYPIHIHLCTLEVLGTAPQLESTRTAPPTRGVWLRA